MNDTDLRQAAVATTFVYRVRTLMITLTCCIVGLVGSVMLMSYLFAAPPPRPQAPKTCGASSIYKTIVDPKPDGNPYLTIICRDGKSWFEDPNLKSDH